MSTSRLPSRAGRASRGCDFRRFGTLFLGLFALTLGPECFAAEPATTPAAKPVTATEKTTNLPELVEISGNELLTADGVALKATFYPGSKGKKSVPVILLHAWKGDRREFDSVAKSLWEEGHAVLVPDLRGHGQSTVTVAGRPLDASRFVANDFRAMVRYDMEALKRYLIKENNAGKLNLEKLCIVGGEMGASVALNWALLDWSWPALPGIKQGQSVKGLVLLSPQMNFRGLGITDAIRNPLLNAGVSMMLLVGSEDAKSLADAQRIYNILERLHRPPTEGREEEEQTLFFKGLDTKVQGTALLAEPALRVSERISKFISFRLVAKDYPWLELGKKPGSGSGR